MKKINFKLIAIVLCLSMLSIIFPKDSLALAASSTTYYVSTQGSDSNPGTELSPWKTIQKAADSVKPGDTVNIRGGIYNERVRLKTSGSDENNYITFENYPGEVVTIDGSGISWGYSWDCLFDLQSKSYIKVIGLKIINSSWFGIGSTPDVLGCQNIIIQKCSTFNTQGSGIAFFHGKNITIDGNSIEQACTAPFNTQECISLMDIATFSIKNNHVFNITNSDPNSGGEGIDVKQGSSDGVICNNIVNDCYKVSIYIDASKGHQFNIEVYGNIVYNSLSGITVATESSGLLENVRIYNNLVYNCMWGLVVADWNAGQTHPMKDIFFVNNTTYNIQNASMRLLNSEAKNVVVVNNIFSGGTYPNCVPIVVSGGNLQETTINHNLLNRIAAGQPTGSNYLVGDPKFNNTIASDFRLQVNSPAIAVGEKSFAPSTDFDNNLRNLEASVDIGCFQFKL